MSAAPTSKRPPLGLPKRSPVVVTHLCADNDVNGNPRRVFVVTTTTGALVETIDEGYYGEAAVYSRYPWFQHRVAERLGLQVQYVQRINVTPAEYRRQLKREGYEGTEAIRERADRYERRYDDMGRRRGYGKAR